MGVLNNPVCAQRLFFLWDSLIRYMNFIQISFFPSVRTSAQISRKTTKNVHNPQQIVRKILECAKFAAECDAIYKPSSFSMTYLFPRSFINILTFRVLRTSVTFNIVPHRQVICAEVNRECA